MFLNDSADADTGALFSVCLLAGELDVVPDDDDEVEIISDVAFVLFENIFNKNLEKKFKDFYYL
jgi:hypothetical protein